jgi:hypothetical protein
MKIRKDLVLVELGNYRISRRDDLNIVVERKVGKKWEGVGFYGYLPQALNTVTKLILNETRVKFDCPELFGKGFEIDFSKELPMTFIGEASEKLDLTVKSEVTKTPKKILNVQGELD